MIDLDKIPNTHIDGHCVVRIFHLRPLVAKSNAEFEAMRKERDDSKVELYEVMKELMYIENCMLGCHNSERLRSGFERVGDVVKGHGNFVGNMLQHPQCMEVPGIYDVPMAQEGKPGDSELSKFHRGKS